MRVEVDAEHAHRNGHRHVDEGEQHEPNVSADIKRGVGRDKFSELDAALPERPQCQSCFVKFSG